MLQRELHKAGVRAVRPACIAMALAAGLLATTTRAQTIRDDFEGTEISPRNWFLCRRGENAFVIERAPGQDFRALRATVRARPVLALFGLRFGHAGCADEDGRYVSDGSERAEIWEADPIQQRFGTEVWYQFSMYVDPSVRKSHPRLVIGQWKQSGDRSPFVAQRFSGRAFTITIEQDNRGPGQNPENTQCRIVVAADAEAAKQASPVSAQLLLPPGTPSPPPAGRAPSLGHDEEEVVHPAPEPAPPYAGSAACATDLKVERLGALPNPFGRWTTMRYHIKAGPEGLLEIWADGQPITRVTGRIGFTAGSETAEQYFKFGPYRDSDPMSVYALLARFRRGPTQKDIE